MSSTEVQTAAQIEVPGYVAGLWELDPVHSEVSFVARHMMVGKVRGHFDRFSAEIFTAPDPLESWVRAEVDLDSVNTGNEQRDRHLRSPDYFDVERYPKMTYRSTSVRPEGDHFVVEGELSLHGVTRPVPLEVEVNGFTKDPYGGTRAGFSARTEINRRDFGIDLHMPMDGGGVVVGDRIQVVLELEAVLKQEAGAEEPAAAGRTA